MSAQVIKKVQESFFSGCSEEEGAAGFFEGAEASVFEEGDGLGAGLPEEEEPVWPLDEEGALLSLLLLLSPSKGGQLSASRLWNSFSEEGGVPALSCDDCVGERPLSEIEGGSCSGNSILQPVNRVQSVSAKKTTALFFIWFPMCFPPVEAIGENTDQHLKKPGRGSLLGPDNLCMNNKLASSALSRRKLRLLRPRQVSWLKHQAKHAGLPGGKRRQWRKSKVFHSEFLCFYSSGGCCGVAPHSLFMRKGSRRRSILLFF